MKNLLATHAQTLMLRAETNRGMGNFFVINTCVQRLISCSELPLFSSIPGNTLHNVLLHRYASIKGTKENEECSNRGICDAQEGICECFTSNDDIFASSDG